MEEEPHDHTPHRACCRAWRRRRGVERPVRKYPNPNRTKDLRPGSRDINLDTHITDVVNLFKWEDLNDAVLVGHSYAGWVISGVVEQMPPANPAHRCARPGGEKDLHPCSITPKSDFR